MNAYISNGFLSFFQAIVVLAEVGCSSVCHPKDGALHPFHSVMDKRQLWSLRCKSLKCFMSDCKRKKMTWNLKHFFPLLFQLEITGTAIWINPFIGVLTITSLWPVAIIFMNTNSLLRSLNMVPKYAMYQVSQHNNFCIYPAFHYHSKPLKKKTTTLCILKQ